MSKPIKARLQLVDPQTDWPVMGGHEDLDRDDLKRIVDALDLQAEVAHENHEFEESKRLRNTLCKVVLILEGMYRE